MTTNYSTLPHYLFAAPNRESGIALLDLLGNGSDLFLMELTIGMKKHRFETHSFECTGAQFWMSTLGIAALGAYHSNVDSRHG